ncbi:hypothetical protein PWT90_10345 [Aphanocladium album]|nr:hypothetical protein PWT90_10345 [Aphanocladium album]
MLAKYCLALFQIGCCVSSAVPRAATGQGIQILTTLDELRQNIQKYTAIVDEQYAPVPAGQSSSNSTYEIRQALDNIITSIQTATKRLKPPLAKKDSSQPESKSASEGLEIGKVLNDLVLALGGLSTRLSTTTGSGSFEDLLHILFNSLLSLVNVIGGLAISIPGIQQLLRLIAALITIFPL